jgi:hypothetical protein
VCFYRPIAEFRKRLLEATGAMHAKVWPQRSTCCILALGFGVTALALGPATSASSQRGRRAPCALSPPPAAAAHHPPPPQTRDAFLGFLEAGKAYYHQLLTVLQQPHPAAGNAPTNTAAAAAAAAAAAVDVRPSVHRCLISMGDLQRYAAVAESQAVAVAGNPGSTGPGPSWASCRALYLQAAAALPGGGNAYNQLAVLASSEEDHLGAAYYYMRCVRHRKYMRRRRAPCARRARRTPPTTCAAAGGRAGGARAWAGWRCTAARCVHFATAPTPRCRRAWWAELPFGVARENAARQFARAQGACAALGPPARGAARGARTAGALEHGMALR